MNVQNYKALIYCRVSSKSQETGGHGLDSQEERCRQFAAAQGAYVVAVFPDTMSGGGDFMKRPGMVAMLSVIDANPNERFMVIFDDLKRASRDTRAFLDLRDAFRQRNTRVECLNFKFEDTPEGEFVETVIAAQGALERKQNGRQVAQKMHVRVSLGYWCHVPPAGYVYETFPEHGRMLVPKEQVASIVREALEGFASGRFASQIEVRRFLEQSPEFPHSPMGNVPNTRVAKMLSQPLYTGHIVSEVYGVSWLKAKHEPLISLETYQKIQDRLKGRAHAPKRANIGDHFALRGVVVCACCKAPMRSSFSRARNGTRHPYYLCQTKSCEAYGKSTRRDDLEEQVGQIIKQLQPTKGMGDLASRMFHHIWAAKAQRAGQSTLIIKRQIAQVEKSISDTVDKFVATENAIIAKRLEEKVGELELEKVTLQEKLAQKAEPEGSIAEKLEPALTFLSNPCKLWDTGQIELRRLVLKLAFLAPIEYCRKQGARTVQISFPFKALGGDLALESGDGGA
ncbi:MAG: recombinase family protein [Pseudomonadota bacterium]